jgi:hypothetical protein
MHESMKSGGFGVTYMTKHRNMAIINRLIFISGKPKLDRALRLLIQNRMDLNTTYQMEKILFIWNSQQWRQKQ